MDGQLLVGLIQTIAFLTPVGLLIWRIAKLDAKVQEHERLMEADKNTINEIKQSTVETTQKILDTLNGVDKKMTELAVTLKHMQGDITRIEEKKGS